jgi:hypothetical protein
VLFVDAVFAIESETCVVNVGFCRRFVDWTDQRDKEMLIAMTAALQLEWSERKFEALILGIPRSWIAGT